MNKSPVTIEVPTVYFSINGTQKPPLRNVTLCSEKNKLYFGSNWKLSFSDISEKSIEEVNQILDQDEHKLNGNGKDNYGYEHDEEEEPIIIFDTIPGIGKKKSFECLFEKPNGRLGKTREREQIRFLTKFIKLYEKWQRKIQKQAEAEENERQFELQDRQMMRNAAFGTSSRNRNGSSRNVYGKRTASSSTTMTTTTTSSRFFNNRGSDGDIQSKTGNPSAFGSSTAFKSKSSSYKRKKTKLERRAERVLGSSLRRGYESFSEDEEEKEMEMEKFEQNDVDPEVAPDQESEVDDEIEREAEGGNEPILKDDDETDEEDLPEAMNSNRKRSLVSKGSRLKKQARIEEDDDSDIEFEHTDNLNEDKNALNDDDDEDEDEDDDVILPKKRPVTTTTMNTEALTDKPSTVTPTRSLRTTATTTQKAQEFLDGAITDEENAGTDAAENLSPDTRNKSEISRRSFFAPKPNPVRKNKTFITTATKQRTLADAALGSPKTRTKLSMLSPLKTKRIQPSQNSPNPVKNPYKKSSTPSTGHVGLRNLGNTCYLNSSLQVLFSIPGFLNDLSSTYEKLASTNVEEGDNENETMPLCSALLSVASRLRLIPPRIKGDSTREGAAYPSILKKQMDKLTDKFAGFEQRDAHEFLSDLIDLLHDEFISSAKDNAKFSDELPTDKYFRLNVDVCLTCDSCNYSRSKEEMYRHLSVDIGTNGDDEPWTVDQGLEKFFQPEQRIIKCEKCESGSSVTQTITVKSRPKALLLHLKRFIVDVKDGEVTWRKSTARVETKASVSLQSFTSDQEKKDENQRYKLQGVVRHIGKNAVSGHYTADAERNIPSGQKKQWVSFDDGISSIASIERILENERSQRNNYIMIYGR